VLHVQDGQNAFTTVGPDAAFGWGSWALDMIVSDLSAAGEMAEIMVGGAGVPFPAGLATPDPRSAWRIARNRVGA
jgi:hypothetical protein